MGTRIYIVLKEDIVDYPPVLSLIRILNRQGYSVYHLGTYSDSEGRQELENSGVKFITLQSYNGKAGIVTKFFHQYSFRKNVENFLKSEKVTGNDIVWILQIETIYLLHNLVNKYNVILHPLEFTSPNVPWKYRVISPSIDLAKTFKNSKKVVCCEYNRAHLTKGIFGLEELPTILPNKPNIIDNFEEEIPADIRARVEEYNRKTNGKKVILYQGIFLDKERRLEEFCDAISKLPTDYVLVAMGRGGKLYEDLKNKYASERIIFLPFIKPPYHLLVTKNAYIGVLSYFPRPTGIGAVINPLYCAPNKIYEYSKFGKPMIANDIPGLYYIFKEYNCGLTVKYPITAESICKAINEIEINYDRFSKGAFDFYDSIDTGSIIASLVKEALP